MSDIICTLLPNQKKQSAKQPTASGTISNAIKQLVSNFKNNLRGKYDCIVKLMLVDVVRLKVILLDKLLSNLVTAQSTEGYKTDDHPAPSVLPQFV